MASITRSPLVSLEHTPTFLAAFLDVLGGKLSRVYGRQTHKALKVILEETRKEGGILGGGMNKPGVARLRLTLEDWEKTGLVKEIEGREPSLD